jgi:hypothetical protein
MPDIVGSRVAPPHVAPPHVEPPHVAPTHAWGIQLPTNEKICLTLIAHRTSLCVQGSCCDWYTWQIYLAHDHSNADVEFSPIRADHKKHDYSRDDESPESPGHTPRKLDGCKRVKLFTE